MPLTSVLLKISADIYCSEQNQGVGIKHFVCVCVCVCVRTVCVCAHALCVLCVCVCCVCVCEDGWVSVSVRAFMHITTTSPQHYEGHREMKKCVFV